MGKKQGDTVFFDKRLRIDTKGGTLAETSTIPENKWKIVKDSVVVTEVGKTCRLIINSLWKNILIVKSVVQRKRQQSTNCAGLALI